MKRKSNYKWSSKDTSLKTVGIVGENTRIYLLHIAPSLHKPHAEIAESIRTDGLEVAYDGLTIEV